MDYETERKIAVESDRRRDAETRQERIDRWAGQIAAAMSTSVGMAGSHQGRDGIYSGMHAYDSDEETRAGYVAGLAYDVAEALEAERTRRMEANRDAG